MKKLILALILLPCLLGSCGGSSDSPTPTPTPDTQEILIPTNVYNNEGFDLSVVANDIVKVEFYVGDELVKTLLSSPFSTKIVLKDLQVGKHTLTCLVETSKGNKIKRTKDFNFKVKIGTEYQGGLIVHLYDNEQHGIIVDMNDLASGGIAGMYYYDHGYGREGVSYSAYDENDGRNNTKLIKGHETDMAAVACRNHRGGGYSDWYLPAIKEFDYIKKYEEILMPGRISSLYWSSTLQDSSHAEVYCFGRCSIATPDLELNKYHYVRPVRRF